MEKKELGYIDALKGLAILAVTMVHTGGSELPGILGKIGSGGASGVQMFFVISGMLTFKSLSRCIPDRKLNLQLQLKWYYKKLIRLVPLFYLTIFISVLTKSTGDYWLGKEGHVTVKNILAHVFLIHGLFPHYANSVLGIEWYLGCLCFFLLASPFLFLLIDTFEKSLIVLIVVHFLNPLTVTLLQKKIPVSTDPIVYGTFIGSFGAHAQLIVFLIGITLYYLLENIRVKDINCGKILSYGLLFFAMIMLYGQVKGESVLYKFTSIEMFGLIFGIIIISQAIHASPIIDNPVFRLYGKYSYEIYLFQFIWINFYDRHIHFAGSSVFPIRFSVSIVALLVIAVLASKFYEKPIQKSLDNNKFS